MSTETGNLIESAEWRNMEDFSEGVETNRLPQAEGLHGTSVLITLAEGGQLTIDFDNAGNATWSSKDIAWVVDGTGEADIVQFLDGAYWVDVTTKGDLPQTITAAFHPERKWALLVHTRVHGPEAEVETPVMQDFHPGWVGAEKPDIELPAPTRDLVGRRTLFRYSVNHLYEHIYLSSRRFVWHNLVGEQRGHAAAELATTYKLDEGLYLFTWREEKIPVGTVFVFDYANGRSTGKFLGLTGANEIQNKPAGAYVIPFGDSDYADHQEPV